MKYVAISIFLIGILASPTYAQSLSELGIEFNVLNAGATPQHFEEIITRSSLLDPVTVVLVAFHNISIIHTR